MEKRHADDSNASYFMLLYTYFSLKIIIIENVLWLDLVLASDPSLSFGAIILMSDCFGYRWHKKRKILCVVGWQLMEYHPHLFCWLSVAKKKKKIIYRTENIDELTTIIIIIMDTDSVNSLNLFDENTKKQKKQLNFQLTNLHIKRQPE